MDKQETLDFILKAVQVEKGMKEVISILEPALLAAGEIDPTKYPPKMDHITDIKFNWDTKTMDIKYIDNFGREIIVLAPVPFTAIYNTDMWLNQVRKNKFDRETIQMGRLARLHNALKKKLEKEE